VNKKNSDGTDMVHDLLLHQRLLMHLTTILFQNKSRRDNSAGFSVLAETLFVAGDNTCDGTGPGSKLF